MQFHQLAHDGQPEPQTGMRSSRRRIGLPEPVEHVRQKLRRDPLSGVSHFDLHAGRLA